MIVFPVDPGPGSGCGTALAVACGSTRLSRRLARLTGTGCAQVTHPQARSYGSTFLDSMPACSFTRPASARTPLVDLQRWLDRGVGLGQFARTPT